MTYARARLWLGITGVGSLVTIATISLATGLPQTLLTSKSAFGGRELLQLSAATGLFMLWLLPLDFLGGYLLPNSFQKSNQSFGSWFRNYCVAALLQASLFVLFSSLIILLSQQFGTVGGAVAVCLGILACFVVRNHLLLNRESKSSASAGKLLDAVTMIQSWQTFVPKTVVVEHKDIGFTGGIVGLGKHAQIVIPKSWLSFTPEQLATAIARRAVAINSGSYTRGLLLAFVWNVGGFVLCSLMPAAGLTTIAGLATTACGFTLWSFFGLLTLPTLSRNASLKIDQELVQVGMPSELVRAAAFSMDQMQDGEPERPRLVENDFPSRSQCHQPQSYSTRSWLGCMECREDDFVFSWACLGFLSRAVHCNVGRPELWTMLPTD